MKRSLKWHSDCFLNNVKYIEELRRHIQEEQRWLDRAERDLYFYQYQIKEAEDEGRTAFDAERFRINSRKGGEQ